MAKYTMAIFDLDGVLVDTAKYHYAAWRVLAEKLGFDFTPEHNERLKGVSRGRSLEILLEVGGLSERFDEAEKSRMAAEKNDLYVSLISKITADELLPGAYELLTDLRGRNVKIGLGSASKNTPLIMERLGIAHLFDAIIDGNKTSKAKPDPEVFLLAVEALNIPPQNCVVFEDAQAGIDAAIAAGMLPIGIGRHENLIGAKSCFENLAAFLREEKIATSPIFGV